MFRRTGNLIEDYVDTSTGSTNVVQPGVNLRVSNRVYANSDTAFRQYQGLVFQGHTELRSNWSVNGFWTVQLQNDGNYEGEAAGQILTSAMGNYPEAFSEARSYPSGRLASFQRHKVNLWSVYSLNLGRAGAASMSGMWRYNSGRVYTLRAAGQPLTTIQRTLLQSAGYVDAPSSQSLAYGALGSESFAGYGMVDLSVNYQIPVMGKARPWLRVDVYNVLDNQKLISWNTTIKPDPNSPVDAMGLRTGYLPGPLFGQGTGTGNYPTPFAGQTGGRTLRAALGVRF